MAKQTYHIKAGSIPAVAYVVVAGHSICQAVSVSDGKTETDPMYLPEEVTAALVEHFRNMFQGTGRCVHSDFDTKYRHQVVKSVTVRAAKNVPGSMVDIKFPEGWKSGYFVQSIWTGCNDRPYRVTVKTADAAKPTTLHNVAPECVRLSARCS